MQHALEARANVLVMGLPGDISTSLCEALVACRNDLSVGTGVGAGRPQAIFCGTGAVGAALAAYPGVPVVAVSRGAEVSEWLDAMDAGAVDCCALPFEHRTLCWILDSILHFRSGRQRVHPCYRETSPIRVESPVRL